MTLFGCLLDPAFYEALPAGAAVSPGDGADAYAAAVAWAMSDEPGGVVDPIAPAYLGFAAAVAAAATPGGRELAPLRAYLAAKLGYRPRLVRLHYSDPAGRPGVVTF